MPNEKPTITPRTFFLNEQHELARGEKAGGGSLPKLAPVDWKRKGGRIHRTLVDARDTIEKSKDPLRKSRYFLASTPSKVIRKRFKDTKAAAEGIREEQTDYAGDHSRVFRRLGLDFLATDHEGRALIHVPAGKLDQLLSTTNALDTEGRREQARWVAIDSFVAAPSSFRIDDKWLSGLPQAIPLDSVVELQPLLTRVEVEQVIHAIITGILAQDDRQKFTRTGTDFSGRHWFRGMLSRESLRLIAKEFFSVQALHPPLNTPVTVSARNRIIPPIQAATPTPNLTDVSSMPIVAVVDVGVPPGHAMLAPFRRGGYTSPDVPTGIVTEHGSHVASRVVFGDPDFSAGVGPTTPACRFLDVNIASDSTHCDDKAVVPALQAVVATYPDVRVFNLSFGDYAALDSHEQVERREKLLMLQDLDNFIFRSDALVVVAAGNSHIGAIPTPNYPDHVDNSDWQLGSWACGFNTLICGSYVGRLSPGGLVGNLNWPSPFTRIGPGLCKAPVPGFSANGGNCTDAFRFAPGLGVWVCNSSGQWEDHIGTSLAAPLLAREAAFVFSELQRRCEQGARPFASTVRAFLTLTADPPLVGAPDNVMSLAARTLGRGTASSLQLRSPRRESAILLWQGILNNPQDTAKIQVPIPRAWLREAEDPCLRVLAAWESPVNIAAEHVWASRKVDFKLRTTSAAKAIRPQGRNHSSYPILDRKYKLERQLLQEKGHTLPGGDFWILEVSYEEISDYSATIEVSPHQRVGIAMELTDLGAKAVSPQNTLQALPNAVTMARLTVPENRIANPIILRPRV